MNLTIYQRAKLIEVMAENDILDLIKSGYFTDTLERPQISDTKKCECGSYYKQENAKEMYTAALKEYRENKALMREKTKYTFLMAVGLDYDSKISKKAFDMAWDNSYGLQDVYYELVELAELLKTKE